MKSTVEWDRVQALVERMLAMAESLDSPAREKLVPKVKDIQVICKGVKGPVYMEDFWSMAADLENILEELELLTAGE